MSTLRNEHEHEHDVVIVGAGSAGVSAAIECFDIQLDVALVEGASKVGGQIGEIPHTVRNVAVAPEGNDALVAALSRHVTSLGPRVHLGRCVTKVDLDSGLVVAGEDRYRARSVLLATGSIRRELSDAPEGSFGGDVTYLVEPHLEDFAGRPAAVFGGGDSAALDALALSEAGSPVFLVHRSRELTARADITERLRSDPRVTDLAGWVFDKLVGSDRLEGVDVLDHKNGERRRLDVRRAVFKIGRQPQVDFVRGQVTLGRRDGIVVDESLRTSHPRTFAAGDVVEGAYERIATAVGQGSYAARSIWRLLQTRS